MKRFWLTCGCIGAFLMGGAALAVSAGTVVTDSARASVYTNSAGISTAGSRGQKGIANAYIQNQRNTLSKSASKLTKRGKGKMTMTAGKMYGALTVENGIVSFNDSKLSTLVHGTFTTVLKDSGRLVGQGLINGMRIENGGELTPCASTFIENTPGTIKCNNTINSQVGSVITFLRNASKNSTLETNNLTLNGVVRVKLLSTYTPKDGDEFVLWTVSNTLSGTPTFDLPDLPDGLYWDVSGLSEKNGVLRITTVPSGISTLKAVSDARNVYDLKGRLVSRQASATDVIGLAPGVYIRGGKKVVVR